VTAVDDPPLAPQCPACRRRHLPALPCWRGVYVTRIKRRTLRAARQASNVPLTMPRCWICGSPATTVDHVVPRAYCGTDHPDNLRPACRTCNSAKQAKPNPFTPEPEPRPTGAGLSPRWRPR
jgi:5-methylcytosine-specific restriction endonuclease McrA